MTRAPISSRAVHIRALAVGGTIAAILTGCAGQMPKVEALSRHHHAPEHLARMAREIANQERIAPSTALALIEVESGFNPAARSPAGAIGLTQIKCQTARGIGYSGSCAGLFDPRVNLTFGLRYLRGNLDQDGSECRALGHYYAGRFGAPSWRYCRLVLNAKSRIAEE